MPSQSYTLDPDNPKRLDIVYRPMWRGATVLLVGQEIGTAPGKQELLQGHEFKLPDGSTLNLRLVQSLLGSQLYILRDGQPIPGSASHPETAVKSAYWTLFLIAGISILFGAAAQMLHLGQLRTLGVGPYSVLFGVAYVALGVLVRRHSLPAMYISIALYAVDTVLGVVLAALGEGAPDMFSIIFRGLLFIPLFQGVGGLRSLAAAESA